ncbi:WxL domain-containing protein [Bombilactobacillus bombi]|uniref:WxL domain-containing protein n=1 Tax=Bombilactobacillus bombi TaxID=1303590 RepID=UPI0015E61177|nr:WxL domain-containing protein [Bombilactobacillus bombi]
MKMNKLFSSIAASAMVLTTLAPAAVANAATGYSTGAAGSGVGLTRSSGSLHDAGMATSGSANVNTGTATAESQATVKIIDGFLVLNAVPDMNFGATVAGQEIQLFNYKGASKDGNKNGALTVIDSRHSNGNSNTKDGMGFKVTATVSPFKNPSNPVDQKGFMLNMAALNENPNPMTSLKSEPVSLPSDGTSTRTVVDASKSKVGKTWGNHTWTLPAHDDAVKLAVPDIAAGEYNATINWTLDANAQ